MFYKLCIVFGATMILFDYTNCELWRVHIQNRYAPKFKNLELLAYGKAEEAHRQYIIFTNQITSHQKFAENTIESYRVGVREAIREAKTAQNVTAKTLECLKTPEALFGKLPLGKPLHSCRCAIETLKLTDIRRKYMRIGDLASKTITFCTNLNPFETQNDTLEKCLSNKIPDLKRQIGIAQKEYNSLINATLQCNIHCLTCGTGDFLGRGSYIRFLISACVKTTKF